jgi:N-methylhydantoinase B
MYNVPLGVRGGLAGGGATQAVRRLDGSLDKLPPCGGVVLQPGETLECMCCGGGGYGDPGAREPEHVRHDVAEGWITAARAGDVYCVQLDRMGEVDVAATAALRSHRPYSGAGVTDDRVAVDESCASGPVRRAPV